MHDIGDQVDHNLKKYRCGFGRQIACTATDSSATFTALLDEQAVWESPHPGQRCEGQRQSMVIIAGFFAHHRLRFDAAARTAAD